MWRRNGPFAASWRRRWFCSLVLRERPSFKCTTRVVTCARSWGRAGSLSFSLARCGSHMMPSPAAAPNPIDGSNHREATSRDAAAVSRVGVCGTAAAQLHDRLLKSVVSSRSVSRIVSSTAGAGGTTWVEFRAAQDRDRVRQEKQQVESERAAAEEEFESRHAEDAAELELSRARRKEKRNGKQKKRGRAGGAGTPATLPEADDDDDDEEDSTVAHAPDAADSLRCAGGGGGSNKPPSP